jgi:hypothetical protein
MLLSTKLADEKEWSVATSWIMFPFTLIFKYQISRNLDLILSRKKSIVMDVFLREEDLSDIADHVK